LFQNCRDAGVQLLPPAPQERAIRRILDQRVLEQIYGVGRDAATEQQSCVPQLAERHIEIGPAGDAVDQLVGELAAEDGPDLCHFLGRRAEPV